ncbi:putative disease resistance protein RGA3 [Humulus lupulus]|uniref:putative disease resistance protein RGA3 n=1 Tax=Humulus lupulus TaxID=3486 RepID=UPI002B413BEC|nr:putative disease resistance protein RGA3 [Humulus lupulus]XP_062115387.1 putative disease resistance protein RGA3 [Humulus lupulus]
MLYFDNSEKEWRDFCYDEIEKSFKHNSSDYDKALSCLKLCYDHLPSRLKHCFAYCSLFPKYHEIDVQTIIKLWMAQGFVINEETGKSAEDVGYEYVLNLLRRSFFQEPTIDVTEHVVKFKIHHLMHDLAALVAEGLCLSFNPNANKPSRPFHVSFGSSNFSESDVLGFTWSRMRSVLLQNHSRGKSGVRRDNNTNTLFDKIIKMYDYNLRALDMCGFGIKIVPNSIGDLDLLKYLDLSENEDIIRLPNSITKLVNLQTLRLSSCFNLKQLPRDIRKLVSLRHLEIDGCHSLTSLPQGIGQLTNLQTLSLIVLGKDSSKNEAQLSKLKNLSNLSGKFQIKILIHENFEPGYLNAVPSGIRTLSLEWDGDDKGLLLFDMSTLVSRRNLVKLSLKRCAHCSYLPPLDELVCLKVLTIDEMIKLEHISNDEMYLPSLQELSLMELPVLKGWWKNNGDKNYSLNHCPSFPCLSKLVIEDCPKLDSMPIFPTLEKGLVLDTTGWKPFQLTMSQSSTLSPPLSKLKNMCIVGIKELDDSEAGRINWAAFQSLRFLRLDYLPLKTLPSGLRDIITLEELHIWRCDMNNINCIDSLEFLKKLEIKVCPNLESLPQGIRGLKYLTTLEIEDCPTLIRRCEKKIGADWEKIEHIPKIRLGRIDGK